MKIAVIGNSHIACLILAHRANPDLLGKDIDPVFFGAAGLLMNDMLCEDGKLVPGSDQLKEHIERTSEGNSVIVAQDFDAFLLMGMGYKVPVIPDTYSDAVVGLALNNQLSGSVLWRLAKALLAANANKPVLCGHKPLAAEELPDVGLVSYDTILTRYETLATPAGLTLVRQPNETRHRDLATQARFAKGSQRLQSGVEHGTDEVFHMNTDYGAIYLHHVAGLLRHSAGQGQDSKPEDDRPREKTFGQRS